MTRLRDILERLYETYDFEERLYHDPIEFPHRYSNERDVEISGMLAASLSYGRVTLFKPVIDRILGVMGKSPAEFVLNFDPARDRRLFTGIRYRFNTTDDILCLIYVLSETIKRWGSVEKCLLGFYDGESVASALTGYVSYILSIDKSPVYGENINTRGFKQFFPSPEKGSPCKRMNLFLRWMVRNSDIDFGIWKGLEKNRLIIPLDTHIARISRCLGLTRRHSHDWRMAEEITESLRELDPDDPLKYDFALCHQGIIGICRSCHSKETGQGCSINPQHYTFSA
jgi:uncharacterized protein (TIGR02757 family)